MFLIVLDRVCRSLSYSFRWPWSESVAKRTLSLNDLGPKRLLFSANSFSSEFSLLLVSISCSSSALLPNGSKCRVVCPDKLLVATVVRLIQFLETNEFSLAGLVEPLVRLSAQSEPRSALYLHDGVTIKSFIDFNQLHYS